MATYETQSAPAAPRTQWFRILCSSGGRTPPDPTGAGAHSAASTKMASAEARAGQPRAWEGLALFLKVVI